MNINEQQTPPKAGGEEALDIFRQFPTFFTHRPAVAPPRPEPRPPPSRAVLKLRPTVAGARPATTAGDTRPTSNCRSNEVMASNSATEPMRSPLPPRPPPPPSPATTQNATGVAPTTRPTSTPNACTSSIHVHPEGDISTQLSRCSVSICHLHGSQTQMLARIIEIESRINRLGRKMGDMREFMRTNAECLSEALEGLQILSEGGMAMWEVLFEKGIISDMYSEAGAVREEDREVGEVQVGVEVGVELGREMEVESFGRIVERIVMGLCVLCVAVWLASF